MEIKKIQCKSVITKSNLPGVDYVINPYVGCQHSCIYCYADFIKRFTGHTGEKWGEFADVKINAPETIPKKNFKDKLILIGSVTDPYQPCEAKYKITRKCLEKLLESQPVIEILTKSPLILKDIDLLKKLNNLKVGVSIGILDEVASRHLEPNVASPKTRINILKKLHKSNIKTYLFVSPIFPKISDYKKVVELSKDYIDEALFENLNIRANNRKRILDFIRSQYPELLEFYQNIPSQYWEQIKADIIKYCRKEKVKYKIYFHHGKRNG